MITTPESVYGSSTPSRIGGSLKRYDLCADQFSGSCRSAMIYNAHLWRFLQPSSCTGFGCGRALGAELMQRLVRLNLPALTDLGTIG
jgi:hypothetical protein